MPFGNSLVAGSPGGGLNIPGNIGGGSMPGKKPSSWLALAAAPLAALIGHGLGGMDYGEALGAFGQGFAGEKYNQLKQRRQSEFEEEGRTIDLAHKAVQDLKDIDSTTIQKFPKLQTLAQKYQQALADDGKISTAEAKEIVILSQHLQSEISQAKQSQGQDRQASNLQAQAQIQDQIKAQQLGRAFPGTEGGSPEELADVGMNLLDQQRLADIPELTSVKLGSEERQIPMTAMQRFSLAKEEERAQRAEEAETRRQNSQERIARYQADTGARTDARLRMSQDASEFSDQLREWRDNKEAAMQELIAAAGGRREDIDPGELRALNAQWDAVRPRKGKRTESIAPPPDVKSVPIYQGKNYSNVRMKK
jgi:hypothetical protein